MKSQGIKINSVYGLMENRILISYCIDWGTNYINFVML